MTQFEVIEDHNCGYTMSIYKTNYDNEWHVNMSVYKDDPEKDQIINYCPMCGRRLNERYYDF